MLTYLLAVSVLSSAATPSRVQQVSGNCNIVMSQEAASATAIQPIRCSQFSEASGESIASSLSKMERFIEASNPTKVDLQGVATEHWLGDSEDYLTLVLTNTSKLPAIQLKVELLAPQEFGQRQSKRLMFTPSHAFSPALLKSLSIPAGDTLRFPIAPLSEVLWQLAREMQPGYSLIAVGTRPEPPSDAVAKYQACHEVNGGSFVGLTSRSLGVQITYKNVFDGRTTDVRGIYLYFARDNRAPENSPSTPCPNQSDHMPSS